MTAMSRDDGDCGDPFQISVITEIGGEVLGFRFPMTAMSRDDADYVDPFQISVISENQR